LPEFVSRDQIVGLLEVYECNEDFGLIFPAFFKDLFENEDLVDGSTVRAEATLF